jgi:hypothetical protein
MGSGTVGGTVLDFVEKRSLFLATLDVTLPLLFEKA